MIEKSKGLCDEMGNIEKVWHFDLQGNENYVIDYKRDGEGNIINKIKTINSYQGGLLHTLTQEHLICNELQHFVDYLFGYDTEGRLNEVTEIMDHYDGECKPIKTSIQTFEIDSDGRWKKVS